MTMRYVELDISALHESKHNPRRHFDEVKLKELADNIAEVGVLSPLIVRVDPRSTTAAPIYEIGAGHRRYRAAKMAKLSLVPCLVREMTDQQFMEFLNIENLQREGLHPLDEAQGYALLMAAPYAMPVEKIADKVGRSIKYVYDRVKLLQLGKAARDLFWQGTIEAGHAILLARLTPTEQAKVIGTPAQDYTDGGLFTIEHRLYDEFEETNEDQSTIRPIKAHSVRELEDWIKRHVRFVAKQADAFLFPETVAKVAEAAETKRKIIEITHEYLADDDVRSAGEAKVYGERAWTRADGHEDSKTCDRSVLGVIASGHGQGQAFLVCINKERCLVHWGDVIREREKRAKEREKGETPGKAGKVDPVKLAQQREANERAREEAVRAQWDLAKPAIWAAVANRLTEMPVQATGELMRVLLDRLPQATRKQAQQYLPCGTSPEELLRFLVFVELYEQINDTYFAVRDFSKRAARLKVDVKKILEELAPKAEVQTPAQDQPAKPNKAARKKSA